MCIMYYLYDINQLSAFGLLSKVHLVKYVFLSLQNGVFAFYVFSPAACSPDKLCS